MTAMLTTPQRDDPRGTVAVRVLPAPRSEPPTDDERGSTGLEAPPLTAMLLPLDLATGVRVQRGRRSRTGRGSPTDPGATSGVISPSDRAGLVAGVAGRPGPLSAPDAAASDSSRATSSGGHLHRPVGEAGASGAGASGAGASGAGASGAGASGAGASGAGASGARGDGSGPDQGTDPLELRTATRRLLATCAEVVGGYRPLGQLRPFCVPDRFDAIMSRLLNPGVRAHGRGHGATRYSVVPGYGPTERGPRSAPRPGTGDRVTVRRVLTCDIGNGVAELAVVMARRDKVWAMALRLELVRGRWLCCHLEVV